VSRLVQYCVLATTLLLAACGGGSSGGNGAGSGSSSPSGSSGGGGAVATTRYGTLLAFKISGLSYSTSDLGGTTDANGTWTYRCNTACGSTAFSIGSINLGDAANAGSVALREFTGGFELGVLSETTLRKGMFLVALDADADPSNGITLSSELATALNGKTLDFAAATFDADLAALVANLRGNTSLGASYRAGLLIPSRDVVRALLEQAEAVERGVYVESPIGATEVRKYVLRVADSSLAAYTGTSDSLRTTFVRGLRPALGGGLAVVPNTGPATYEVRAVSSRGITVAAPSYFDGVTKRVANVIVSADPNAAPSIGTFQLTAAAADLKSITSIKTSADVAYSSRPTPLGASGSDGARNLDEALKPRDPEFDQQGLDPAGVTIATDGTTWVCDRRGPFLLRLDAQGRSAERLGPAGDAGALPNVSRTLPKILEARQAGLGCGGVAMRPTSGDVLFSVAAPLDILGRTAKTARLVRLVSYNPRTLAIRQYGLPILDNEFSFQVLDLETLAENRVLALVRFRDGNATAPWLWEVRVFDLTSATEISSKVLTSGPNSSLALEYGTANDIASSNVTLATSFKVIELRTLGWSLDGPEGLAKLDSQTLLVMAQVNGGVTSRIVNGDPNLKVEEHQVDVNGLITPRAAGSTVAPTFAIVPNSAERREIVLWSIKLRTPLN